MTEDTKAGIGAMAILGVVFAVGVLVGYLWGESKAKRFRWADRDLRECVGLYRVAASRSDTLMVALEKKNCAWIAEALVGEGLSPQEGPGQ